MKKILKKYFKLSCIVGRACYTDTGIGSNLSLFMSRELIDKFCNEFNRITKIYRYAFLIYIVLYLYTDKTFFFIIKGLSLSTLIKSVLLVNKLDNYQIYKLTLKEFYYLCYLKHYHLIITQHNYLTTYT